MKSRLTKISTVALTATAALLMTGFAPVSAAEETPAPAGIEVITVTAKRIEPSVASACVDTVKAQAHATTAQQQEAAIPTPAEVINGKLQFRRAVRDCIEQSAAGARS